MKIFEHIKSWYQGETKVIDNPPDATVIFIGVVTEYHWTAKVARHVVAFSKAHWQFIIGTILTIAFGVLSLI